MTSKFTRCLVGLLTASTLCTVATASASAYAWLKDGTPITKTEEVTFNGERIILKASTKFQECTAISGKGTVGTGGVATLTEMKWTGCKTGQAGCKVMSVGQPFGTIALTNIPAAIVERSGVLAEEIKSNPTTKEILELRYAAEPGHSCSEYPENRLKGQVAAKLAAEQVEFANPELTGNSLEMFGVASKLFGFYKQQFTLGGALSAE